jgi:hypothetical protein
MPYEGHASSFRVLAANDLITPASYVPDCYFPKAIPKGDPTTTTCQVCATRRHPKPTGPTLEGLH